VTIILTRKQSITLGIGLLGLFFLISVSLVVWNSSKRVPTSSSSLTRESIGSTLSEDSATPSSGVGSAFVLNQFKRNLVKDGRVVWEIVGQKGEFSPGSNVAEIQSPELTLATKNGDPATVTAGKAVLTMNGTELGKADLFDNVILRYKNETTLRTSQASYDKSTETVTVPVYVEIENGTGFTSGNSLVGNIITKEFTLEGGVKTIIQPQK
jgi:LPS export ABC transporter protein LptC